MRLYVNVDHVATVRQARRTVEPDPTEAADAARAGGADGITVHLREDRRHIQDDDVRRLAARDGILNLELATADDIVALAVQLAPHQATLVPERREEITTEGGLDLGAAPGEVDPRLVRAIAELHEAGVRVSLFIDPDAARIEQSAALGVEAVELHTGAYANADEPEPELHRLARAVRHAGRCGLAVHAGHGLTYGNVTPVAALSGIEELNIGHSIVSRSLLVGMRAAVAEMRELVDAARQDACVD